MNRCIRVALTCRDCGLKNSFYLLPSDMDDWGWMMANSIKECGFETSDKYAYCNGCAKNHKRGWLNSLRDEMKEE